MNQTYAVQTTGNSTEGKHKHDLEELEDNIHA